MDKSAVGTAKPGLALWKWLLLPLMSAVIVMAYLWAGDIPTFQDPTTARIIFWHVPMAIISMVWFAAAAVYSIRYLLRADEKLDTRAAASSEMGLLLTVLATVTGAVFSKMQWAGGPNTPWYVGYWQWDPKQTAIVIVILIFAAYFGLRMSVDDSHTRARLSAVYAVLGFVAVPFLYYVLPQMTKILGITMHPENVINTREGLDTAYRITFWLANLGFLGISIWAYQIRVRLALLAHPVEKEAADERVEAVRKPGGGGAQPRQALDTQASSHE